MEVKMSVEGQGDNITETTEQSESVNVDEFNKLQESFVSLKQTNERLLNESKEWSNKYRSIRDENAKKEKDELEKAKDFESLLEKERNEKFEVEKRFNNLKKSSLEKSLKFDVVKYGADAYDVDMLADAVLRSEMVSLDDSELGFQNVKDAIDALRKEKSFMFKPATKTPMVNSLPNTKEPSESGFLAELKNAKSQKEFDEIRKKYGKF